MSLLELYRKSAAVEGNLFTHKKKGFYISSSLAPILADIYLCVVDSGVQARIESMVPNSVIVKRYVEDF